MATDKNNQFPAEATRQDFPEVKDKIVNSIEVSSDDEYFGVTISFQDRTALTLQWSPVSLCFPFWLIGQTEKRNPSRSTNQSAVRFRERRSKTSVTQPT